MEWEIVFAAEAQKDFDDLNHTQQIRVAKALQKVAQNPLPVSEGGYGKPLGNKMSYDLTGLLKVKLRGDGLRIVYKLIKTESQIFVLVIGVRDDAKAYREAAKRRKRHGI